MQINSTIKKNIFLELSQLLIFAFFTTGCHTSNEAIPVKMADVKKAEVSKQTALDFNKTDFRKKIPETSAKNDASGILFPKTDTAADTGLRDPFAFPTELKRGFHNGTATSSIQKEQRCTADSSVPVTAALNRAGTTLPKNTVSTHPPASQAPYLPQDPFVYGLFESSKEKLALLSCNQIRGLFRSGDMLPNGYHVGEVTNSSVTLYPPQDAVNNKPLILKLQ